MAFPSTATAFSADCSRAFLVSEKLPKLIVRSSLSTNYQKESLTIHINDTPVHSKPLKHLNCPTDIDDVHVEHERKLKAFKHMLSRVGEDSIDGLAIIDAAQRLGIDYHFQEEIRQIMQRQYMRSITYSLYQKDQNLQEYQNDQNLHEIALRFRLLRQEGYNVSADVFNKFTDKNGKFNQKVSEDINGLMALYEASQLCIEGEDVLYEAADFSAKLLNEAAKNLDYDQAKIVRNTLQFPYHISLARFTAKRFFLSDFQGENGWIHVLQELAKMDFNYVQTLHQKEIVQISKWWKDLGLAKKLEFARDQPLKWYIWSNACLTDASYSWQRVQLTKPISFIYIIDDIYDVDGTLDELTLFTEAVNRWDHDAIGNLPDYLRICFKALDDMTNEISNKVYQEHGYNPLHSLRKTWSSLCDAFLVEAKWFNSSHIPKAEDYLKNGIISSGVHVVLVHIFYLLGHNLTGEAVQLIDNQPGIISSTATILRLWDDLGSAKDENQDGKDGSYIHYYMKEHPEANKETAQQHTISKISDAWKKLNKECLSPNPFSSYFIRSSLNLARMVPLMYSYDGNQRLPSLEEYIRSLLFENEPTRGVY